MFNKVVLVGNLTRDIELRYLPSGSAIGKTAIAVTRRFTGSNGEKKEEACFIDIDFFGRLAEIANQYLNKGSKVLIEGRLKYEQWSDQNGQNRSKHTISVENMEMLGSNPNSGNYGANAGYGGNSGYNSTNSGAGYGGQNNGYGGGNFAKGGASGAYGGAQNAGGYNGGGYNSGANSHNNAGAQSFDPYASAQKAPAKNQPQYAEEKLKEIDIDADLEADDKNELPF